MVPGSGAARSAQLPADQPVARQVVRRPGECPLGGDVRPRLVHHRAPDAPQDQSSSRTRGAAGLRAGPHKKCHESETKAYVATCETTEEPQVTEDQHVTRGETLHWSQVSHRLPAVDPARLAHWCEEQLGSPPAGEIFRSGYLSAVIGLRLADSRAVVVKVRPDSPRMVACVEVQRRLFESGYPCPEPLTGATPFGDAVATAEAYIPGGSLLPCAGHSAGAFAGASRGGHPRPAASRGAHS